jgi:membrane-associated HD superfamily phosphohydrolase
MSIPIDFQTTVQADIGKDNVCGTLVQLKDGSLYIVSGVYEDTNVHDILPVSRSWAGMILRESIRQTMRRYAIERKYFKIAKYSFRKTGNEDMISKMNTHEETSKECLTLVKHQRKCWKKFKDKSTKKVKVISEKQFKDGQKKKEKALKAKYPKPKKSKDTSVKVGKGNKDVTFTHQVSMEMAKHGAK